MVQRLSRCRRTELGHGLLEAVAHSACYPVRNPFAASPVGRPAGTSRPRLHFGAAWHARTFPAVLTTRSAGPHNRGVEPTRPRNHGLPGMAPNPSQRPTREWPLLVLALALVCAVCVPLWQWSAGQPRRRRGLVQVDARAPRPAAARPRTDRLLLRASPGPASSSAAAIWKSAASAGPSAWTCCRPTSASASCPKTPGCCKRKVEQTAARGGPYILANMIRLALGKYAVSRSGRDVGETVRTQADVDLGRLVSSMATVHYLAWAIPAIGFLGTVRGLATSLTLGGADAAATSPSSSRRRRGTSTSPSTARWSPWP